MRWLKYFGHLILTINLGNIIMAELTDSQKKANDRFMANRGDYLKSGVEAGAGVASGIGAMLGYKDTRKSLKQQRAAMWAMKKANERKIALNLAEHRENQARDETQHTITDLLEDGDLVMAQSMSGFVVDQGSYADQIDSVDERQAFDLETRDMNAKSDRFALSQQYHDAQNALDQQIASVNQSLKQAKSNRNAAYIGSAIQVGSAVAGLA